MGSKVVDFYLPEQNTVVEFLSGSHFNFDKATLSAKGLMWKRIVSGAEEAQNPQVRIFNTQRIFQKNKE